MARRRRSIGGRPRGRTIALIIADHGESPGEHGEGTHGLFLYDATLRVPCGDGRAGSHEWARGEDGRPSDGCASDAARPCGLPIRGNLDGRVHARGRRWTRHGGGARVRGIVVFTMESGWAPLFTWRTARFKFIDAPKPELRDLQQNPSETTNGVTDERVRAYDLRQSVASTLRTWVDRQLEPGDAFPEKVTAFSGGYGGPWPLRTSMFALRRTRAAHRVRGQRVHLLCGVPETGSAAGGPLALAPDARRLAEDARSARAARDRPALRVTLQKSPYAANRMRNVASG